MERCIYTGADSAGAHFSSAEHIFPECIGGVHCLPKGWVSDEANNALSRLELTFARENPLVAIQRMFLPPVGRKKHANRDRIGVLTNLGDRADLALGYICGAQPFPLNQIVFSVPVESEPSGKAEVRILLAPSADQTAQTLLPAFWEELREYNGCPSFLKSPSIPPRTYLLGRKDKKWFLGLHQKENPELVKPVVRRMVEKLTEEDAETACRGFDQSQSQSHRVEACISFCVSLPDCLRVYAKIALNCLARLAGQEFVLSAAFDPIRAAIMDGTEIASFVWGTKGPHPVPPVLWQFPDRLTLGKRCHAVCINTWNGDLYGIVSLYGLDDPMVVLLARDVPRFGPDFYLCDWENKAEYTLIDCVLRICDHGEPC